MSGKIIAMPDESLKHKTLGAIKNVFMHLRLGPDSDWRILCVEFGGLWVELFLLWIMYLYCPVSDNSTKMHQELETLPVSLEMPWGMVVAESNKLGRISANVDYRVEWTSIRLCEIRLIKIENSSINKMITTVTQINLGPENLHCFLLDIINRLEKSLRQEVEED
uniref:Uncharacterized protein n=1 Tax=viral metagenome TaxID=1070528 RepID=A0A6C0DYQ5_9ZZZZ